MIGMTVAAVTTAALIYKLATHMGQDGLTGLGWVLAALVVGGTA